MKKRFGLVLLAVFSCIAFVPMAHAQEKPAMLATANGRWKPFISAEQDFPQQYAIGRSCVAGVFANRRGVRLIARSEGGDVTAVQITTITKRRLPQRLVRRKPQFQMTSMRWVKGILIRETRGDDGWDLYSWNCAEYDAELPPTVRKFFWGYYAR